MEVRTCRRCKKIFQYITGPQICPRCKQKEEEMFQVVKEYLRQNPGATMNIVSQETEVSVAIIEGFLRQGRLEVTSDSPIALSCESCGVRILTGRLCQKCNASLVGGLSSAAKEIETEKRALEEKRKGEKMRFLKSDQIR